MTLDDLQWAWDTLLKSGREKEKHATWCKGREMSELVDCAAKAIASLPGERKPWTAYRKYAERTIESIADTIWCQGRDAAAKLAEDNPSWNWNFPPASAIRALKSPYEVGE